LLASEASKMSLNSEEINEFKYSEEELKKLSEKWQQDGWPVQLLLKDHLSAKIFQDNDLFNTIKFYKHEWKVDDEEGLLIQHKKTGEAEPHWTQWSNLLPSIKLKKNKKGEFKFENASYGADGFEYEIFFQLSPSEFKSLLQEWVQKSWPVKFLMRDHYGAKILYDNQVFPLIAFYGHDWTWDEEIGLSILFKKTLTSPAELTPWKDIAPLVPVCRTPQGWLLFDGWNYTPEGLIPDHLWQWKELRPSFVFPKSATPKYCYLDIVSYCWEHEGMQGFGIRTPHGHLAMEFADEQGNFYSVGQYMDPRAKINTKHAPAATVRAVLMSPDPYMPSKGEKTIHRYSFGSGAEGRNGFAKLKKRIETIQGWKIDSNGLVSTCPRKYNTIGSNCGDFVREIEQFAQEECDGKLVKIADDEIYIPGRERVVSRVGWFSDVWSNLYNRFILFMVDWLILFVTSVPWIAKKIGKGVEDGFDEPYFAASTMNNQTPSKREQESLRNSGAVMYLLKKGGSFMKSFGPKPLNFPVRIRIEQLYSPRLKRYSIKLKS